jgi:hypothetical protein
MFELCVLHVCTMQVEGSKQVISQNLTLMNLFIPEKVHQTFLNCLLLLGGPNTHSQIKLVVFASYMLGKT